MNERIPKNATLVENLGPNEVCLYHVPGKRPRTVIDSTYLVAAVIDGDWRAVARYSDRYHATAFAQGYMRGARDVEARS